MCFSSPQKKKNRVQRGKTMHCIPVIVALIFLGHHTSRSQNSGSCSTVTVIF